MDEFYVAYGKVIDDWAFIEFVLSQIFRSITQIDKKLSAAIFYSERSFQTRKGLLPPRSEARPSMVRLTK